MEPSIKEQYDVLIERSAQIKAKEIIDECNVTSKHAKMIILDACRVAMKSKYQEMYGNKAES